MFTVDKTDAMPLHLQVRNVLRNEILKGTYTEKIPSEYELMEMFSVSRATIRRAVRTLTEEGVLETKQGLGTFVSARSIEEWLGNLSTYFEIVQDMGMKPNIRLLSQGIVPSPQDVAVIFGTKEIYETNRLRLANDVPIVVEKQYYPLKIGQKLAEVDLNNASTYEILENEIGITLWEAKQTITAIIPTAEEKKLLNLSAAPSCALLSKRLVVDLEGKPWEYEKSLYRADMYSFRINLTRKRKR
ncbi:GntR family transcriptional regulator [Sporomusa sp. KB1]|jgi:GntR family transcriptional regulator|uniref:GntR family transcriptional regulator n=1 Tax=Sporomusa sp. KB1 TaxID=943346 RepID=UPI0011A35E27|nr:GntR family transcriptional regulator [Sporomusa sp. KB1]TWH51885.1 GntR family transcriptional regulator [Sporomusa sp. KB1]